MKRFNICTKKVVNGYNPMWRTVGTLTEFPPDDKNPDGGYALDLFLFPGTKLYVLPQRETKNGHSQKDASTETPKANEEAQTTEGDENDTPC